MSLVVDLVIIIAAIAAVYLGIVRGFIRSVMSFVSLILAIVAAYLFTAPVAAWLSDNVIREPVSAIVDEALVGIVTAGSEKIDLKTIIADRPEALTSIADRFGADLDELAAYYDAKLADLADTEAMRELADTITAPTTDAVSTTLAAIGVFLAALLALKFITFILDMIFKLPLLDSINAFLGGVFGFGSAIVTSWVIANIAVGLITALESIDSSLFNETVISGSIILRFFFEHSLILFV